MTFTVGEVLKMAASGSTQLPDGRWVPARPLRPSWGRWRSAWLVLTDRADALVWPEDEKRAQLRCGLYAGTPLRVCGKPGFPFCAEHDPNVRR